MSVRRLLRGFVSARTTVALLCLLALLLLLNVVIPQRAVLGEQAFDAMVRDRPLVRFLLVDLGFGRIPTSPPFLVVLTLFFANLLAVVASRVGPILRRISPRPRAEKGLQAWARLEESLTAPLPAGWSAGHAATTLRGFGYRVKRPGDRTFWGVKHASAPLGFVLFHVSFLLICAGGTQLYYTRFVGETVLGEGQRFDGTYGNVVREAPVGHRPDLEFSVERVEPRFERGEPVHLGAVFAVRRAGRAIERRARVNHPARWGDAILMVHRAGLAPVLWLQDRHGYTVDRVVVPVRTREGPPTRVPLGDGALMVLVHRLPDGADFPTREQLADTALRLQITRESRVVFDGRLAPGEAADLEDGRLLVEELRYWVGVRVVAERGGGLLTGGFVVGIVGLVWRLLMYRREVALTWDGGILRLVGRSEYYSGRFSEELGTILSTLVETADSPAGRRPREGTDVPRRRP